MKILSDHGLIKRVGVASFVYVHKSHIRPWLVHSFHIKRLEKENMASKSSLKRKAEDVILDITNEDDDQPSSSKKAKENNGEMIKRVSKPVERFEAGTDNSDVNLNAEGVRYHIFLYY